VSYAPGGPAAPNYGQPPGNNHAGLVIVLLLVLLIAVLTVGGVVAYRLISDETASSSAGAPVATKSSAGVPTKAGVDLARRFAAQLNANKPAAAAAMACEGSKGMLPHAIELLQLPTKLTVTGTSRVQADILLVSWAGTARGSRVTGHVALHYLDEPLCISDFLTVPR
jgi:hypothetical protein